MYSDLRPVLFQYEGTIHGFIRHHNNVFTLIQKKGKDENDPIVQLTKAAEKSRGSPPAVGCGFMLFLYCFCTVLSCFVRFCICSCA